MDTGLSVLRPLSDRALAKARAKLHIPALCEWLPENSVSWQPFTDGT
jgi:hypothetical protein